jgi:hypothetical protein
MELTLEIAKKLSVEKWELIVENNGSKSESFLKRMPELIPMLSHCAMCQFVIAQQGGNCINCLYTNICDEEYQNWSTYVSKEKAQIVLDAIIEANKIVSL